LHSSGNRLIQLRNSFRGVFGSDGLGIQDGLCANQAIKAFSGKAEYVQGLQASFVIHSTECNGFGFEVATKLDTKKLDLIGEVCRLNQAEAHFFSLFELIGIKAMFDRITIAGLSTAFSVQRDSFRFDRPDVRLFGRADSLITACRNASICSSSHFS